MRLRGALRDGKLQIGSDILHFINSKTSKKIKKNSYIKLIFIKYFIFSDFT